MQSLSSKELATQVKILFNEQGPLCDSEGFYNHTGECWNDTLQMIFLNSDFCKESVQSKLALGEIDPFEVETIFEPVLEKMYIPEMVKEDFIQKWVGLITLYLETLQNRFRRHYMTESLRLGQARAKGVCSLEDAKGDEALKEMLKLAMTYRAQGKEGRLGAFSGQSFTKYNIQTQRDPKKIETLYIPGGETSSRENVDMIFKHFFSIPFTETKYTKDSRGTYLYRDKEKQPFSLKDSVFAVYIGSHTIRRSGSGHASCFYTCGNREYFFDDNYGSIQFPWKKALKFFAENQRNDIIINLYFDGYLKISDPSGKVLFEHDGYPFFYFTFLGKRGTGGKQSYNTYLWDGTEIRVILGKTNIEEYKYERKMGENTLTFVFNDATNATDSLHTYEIAAEHNWLKPEIKPFVKGRANEQTGFFIGSRLNRNKEHVEEILLDEQLKKVAAGKAKIDDFFYQEGEEKYNPLQYAIYLNSLEYVKKVLDMGADIKVRGVYNDSALFFAVSESVQLDILKLLVERGADVNDNNNLEGGLTPLIGTIIFQVEDEGEDVVKFLLEKGANIHATSKRGTSAIEYAVFLNRYKNILDILQEHGAELPKCPTKQKLLGENLLMKAIEKEEIVKAGLLAKCYRELELYEEINHENLVGETPLIMLMRLPYGNYSKELFKILIRNGADVNHIDRFGGTPLHHAISSNNPKWVKFLLLEGAKSNVIVRGLGSPLHYAKRLGNPEIIKLVEEEDKANPLAYVMAVPKTYKATQFGFTRRVKKATNMPRPAMGGRKTRRKH